jgi:NADPH2:quinone reductase
MRAAYYESFGTAREVLRVGELPTPEPAPGEVRVRMHFSGVNPSDVKTRGGMRGGSLPFPRIVPHSDGSGFIDAVGEGVGESRIGERVWIWNAGWKRADGTAAEYVTLPEAQAVALPDQIDLAAGACLGIPALTAYHAVVCGSGVEDKTVLVAGGAGAVGHYAVQLAKIEGASRVIASVSGQEKAELAQSAGADLVVNYREEDLVARCREATGGLGVERIVEVDLAANIGRDLEILSPDGDIVAYGSGAAEVPVPFLPSILGNVTLRFFIVYNLSASDRTRAQARLTELLEQDRLSHNVTEQLPLEEVVRGHELIEQGRLMGNLVLQLA